MSLNNNQSPPLARKEPSNRPDKALLERALYPFSVDIATRFQDLDMLGHINNVAIGALFEEARFAFGSRVDLRGNAENGVVMVGSVHINYLAEARHGTPMRFYLGVGYLGRSSWRLWAAAYQTDRCVMIGDTTTIYTEDRRPSPLPNTLRDALEGFRLKNDPK